ncbi:MAG: SRPBCC family protein [Rhizobiaceae bacterium]
MPHIIAPDLDPDDSNYAHCQVIETLPIPADSFFDWYMDEPPENFMMGTLVVSPITGTEPISKEPYGKPGTSRLFNFKDGTVARERIISMDMPREYFYQPYGYDNPIHLLSDYAKSTMRAEPDGENTRIVWDYAFHAKNKVALQVVRLFVSFDWKRNLQNGLTVIKAHLEEHGTSKRIHEVIARDKAA